VDQISRGAGCRRSIIDLLQAVDDHASDPAHNEPHLFKKGAAAGASVLNDSNLRGGPHTARIKRSLSPSILIPGSALRAEEELSEGFKGRQT
jgi:hypothetical protein